MVTQARAGLLLRQWRQRRQLSQLDLALGVGVSARHLSFVETGRSNASPELLLALAERLEVPLREQNSLLLAAGYAPRFGETRLEDPAMDAARTALERMLTLHDPYPGLAMDLHWNVVLSNKAATRIAAALPPELAEAPLNVFRACLHPDGLAKQTLNFPEWAAYLLHQLDRLRLLTADPGVSALADEVGRYPNVAALPARHGPFEPTVLIPWQVRLDGTELSFLTTLTSFGTPRDITLAELAVELFYPTDTTTEEFFSPLARSPA
jgi:transcriptional regulator with XRE-family HTH domain